MGRSPVPLFSKPVGLRMPLLEIENEKYVYMHRLANYSIILVDGLTNHFKGTSTSVYWGLNELPQMTNSWKG